MLIPSRLSPPRRVRTSLSRRVNANSQLIKGIQRGENKLIKKGEG